MGAKDCNGSCFYLSFTVSAEQGAIGVYPPPALFIYYSIQNESYLMRLLLGFLVFSLPITLLSGADEELDERLKAVMLLFDKKHQELNVRIGQLEIENQKLSDEVEKLQVRNQGLIAENESLRKQLGLMPAKQIETASSPRDLEALQSRSQVSSVASSAPPIVNINTASLVELETLPGVGPVIAQRIVDSRPYATPDDLLKVRGIGKTSIEILKPMIRIE